MKPGWKWSITLLIHNFYHQHNSYAFCFFNLAVFQSRSIQSEFYAKQCVWNMEHEWEAKSNLTSTLEINTTKHLTFIYKRRQIRTLLLPENLIMQLEQLSWWQLVQFKVELDEEIPADGWCVQSICSHCGQTWKCKYFYSKLPFGCQKV